MQARLDGKSIQHLLNLSLPVFAHPLMVVGMDFSIIAAASEEPSFFPRRCLAPSMQRARFCSP